MTRTTCSKCSRRPKKPYHAWCGVCLNAYQRKYRTAEKQAVRRLRAELAKLKGETP